MQVEHRIAISASPETIFGIYEDVQNWHTWDPDTKQAYLEGPFRVGSRGRITPPKGMSVPMLFTQVEPGRCFTVESKIPLFCMLFEHELVATPGATEVIHRVTFSGLLSFVLGPMLSRQLNAGLPVTLGKLKALAEGIGSAAATSKA
ncbi:SRPBCC family protein [Undibacterium sp. Ren11W]|uniref:SRPBCC family protein n=1 Tax=Undibacterium sp. Ren11W TaxID=3413045 RepID=UPI003BF17D02